MKLKISANDYHTILSTGPRFRIALSVDDNQIVHPEVMTRYRAGVGSMTPKRCIESLEAYHDLRVMSDADIFDLDVTSFSPEGGDGELTF